MNFVSVLAGGSVDASVSEKEAVFVVLNKIPREGYSLSCYRISKVSELVVMSFKYEVGYSNRAF